MWTYSGNPSASPTDLVHYRLGDVNPAEPVCTDEECAQALADNGGNSWLAAADIAESRAAAFFNRPSTVRRGGERNGRTVVYSQQVEGWLAMARSLRMQASVRTTSVYGGGLSVAEHTAGADVVAPFARKNLFIRPAPAWSQHPAPLERED
jgi:hypothetical protein